MYCGTFLPSVSAVDNNTEYDNMANNALDETDLWDTLKILDYFESEISHLVSFEIYDKRYTNFQISIAYNSWLL